MVSTNHQIDADSSSLRSLFLEAEKGEKEKDAKPKRAWKPRVEKIREKQIGTLNPSNHLVLKEAKKEQVLVYNSLSLSLSILCIIIFIYTYRVLYIIFITLINVH